MEFCGKCWCMPKSYCILFSVSSFCLFSFLFFTCLFVCLFVFTWEYSPTGCYVWSRDWNIFLTRHFFFTFDPHLWGQCCGSYNTCSWNVRPFFHVFVGNQSKRRWFKFWKKNFVEIRVIVLKRSFLTVGRNCTVMRPIIPNKKNNNQRTNSWQKQGFHFLSIIVRWLNLIYWQFLKFTPLCSENRCPSWIHFSDPKMNWHYMLTQIYVDLLIF